MTIQHLINGQSLASATTFETINPATQDVLAEDPFSGTVIVADHGTVVYAGAHGDANKDHRVPNRLDTGMTYVPRATRNSLPSLVRRDKAWSTASRLPMCRNSFGDNTPPSGRDFA